MNCENCKYRKGDWCEMHNIVVYKEEKGCEFGEWRKIKKVK